MKNPTSFDVIVIGAGPSGTCAASLLLDRGFKVIILEKEVFPRFSIGESLLPQSMVFLEKAGLLGDVEKVGFQPKDGAVFLKDGVKSVFEFKDKFTSGPSQTFQVQRALFDKTLADTCQRKGVPILYQHEVLEFFEREDFAELKVRNLQTGSVSDFSAQFVLDASGFGRVLPRLLKLEVPSIFPTRQAVFCHMNTQFPSSFDPHKILITVDSEDSDVWIWTIPFPHQTCSFGVVGTEDYFRKFKEKSYLEIIETVIDKNPALAEVMQGSTPLNECRTIIGYSADVKTLYGPRFALLGNAGEFLDPVFSSGVTIALHSANLAVEVLTRQLHGEAVDWENQFSRELKKGINTFKTFVRTWYTGELQKILFYPKPQPRIKKMICSILAGYAWDHNNYYVAESEKGVNTLAEICSESTV